MVLQEDDTIVYTSKMSIQLTVWMSGVFYSQNQKFTYSSVLHSHTVLMTLCPCARYRQLNSVLYPVNHILKLS